MPGLAYEHLNLKFNPFGELDFKRRREIVVLDVDRYLEFMEQPRAALLFYGDKGHGKTSHLLGLSNHFPGAPYIHFPEDGPRPSIPYDEPILILDELQRASWWQCARLFASETRLILGSHWPHGPALRFFGRPQQTVRFGALSPAKLEQVLTARIELARRAPGPVPHIEKADLEALIERFGANIRRIEWHLYESIQKMTNIGAVPVDF